MNWLKFWVICICFALVGCGSPIEAAKKIGQVIIDPSIQVGEKEAQPSTIRFSLLADPDINPNFSGNATPLQVTVVYLREDSKLLNLALDELTDVDIETVLGKNYLDHQDYTLIPGQFKTLDEIKLYKENQYIAVIAYYAADADAEWKSIIPAKGKGEEYKLLIHAKTNSISIRQDGDNPVDLDEFETEESPDDLYLGEESISDEYIVDDSNLIVQNIPSEIQSEEFSNIASLNSQTIYDGAPLKNDIVPQVAISENLINSAQLVEENQVPYPFLASSRAYIAQPKEPMKWHINGKKAGGEGNNINESIEPKTPVTRIILESTQSLPNRDFINVRATNKVVIIESTNQTNKNTNSK